MVVVVVVVVVAVVWGCGVVGLLFLLLWCAVGVGGLAMFASEDGQHEFGSHGGSAGRDLPQERPPSRVHGALPFPRQ